MTEGKTDLFQYSGNKDHSGIEPLKSGCPKMHPCQKELQNWGNCKKCLRTPTGADGGLLSEWRACFL